MKDWVLAAFTDEAGDSFAEQILAMNENGITGMEIRSVDGRNVSELSVNEARDLGSQLAAEGLSVWSVGSPIGKISLQDDFEKHLDNPREIWNDEYDDRLKHEDRILLQTIYSLTTTNRTLHHWYFSTSDILVETLVIMDRNQT